MPKQSLIIGRNGDIRLFDDTVSRQHAMLLINEDSVVLKDTGSRNGTFAIDNGKLRRFEEGRVQPGQVFSFGECVRSIEQLLAAAKALEGGSGNHVFGEDTLDDIGVYDPVFERTSLPSRTREDGEIARLTEQIESAMLEGARLVEACARAGVSPAEYHEWRNAPAPVGNPEGEALAEENARLRALIDDLKEERDVLREALAAATSADEDVPREDLSSKPVSSV